MENKRECGYYHVRFLNGNWGVAYYSSGYWLSYGNIHKYYDDSHYLEVGEKAERGGGWVKVEDRLPEDNGYYLVACSVGLMAEMHTYSDKTKTWNAYSGNKSHHIITHWIPKIELPSID